MMRVLGVKSSSNRALIYSFSGSPPSDELHWIDKDSDPEILLCVKSNSSTITHEWNANNLPIMPSFAASEDGNLSIVDIGSKNSHLPKTGSDGDQQTALTKLRVADLILQQYCCAGITGLKELSFPFAAVIFDRESGRLILARDPYGQVPLVYRKQGDRIAISTRIKDLQHVFDESCSLNPSGLASFALLGHLADPLTTYREIRSVPAGCAIAFSADGVQREHLFASLPQVILQQPSKHSVPPDELHEITSIGRTAVLNSLQRHVEDRPNPALLLSSGLDSAVLLGLMREIFPDRPIDAITLCFDHLTGTELDESKGAQILAKHYGARHHLVRIADENFRQSLPQILQTMDRPSIDGVNAWFAARALRDLGFNHAISGLGGDELFATYSTFSKVPATIRLASLSRINPKLGRCLRKTGEKLLPFLNRKYPKALSLLELGQTYAVAYLAHRGLFMPHELAGFLGEEVARQGLAELGDLAFIDPAPKETSASPLRRVALLESTNYLRDQLLGDHFHAFRAFNIELHTPFVDWRLLQTVAPHLDHFNKGRGRVIKGALVQDRLPDQILARKRSGFAVPMSVLHPGKFPTSNGHASRLFAAQVLAQLRGQTVELAA